MNILIGICLVAVTIAGCDVPNTGLGEPRAPGSLQGPERNRPDEAPHDETKPVDSIQTVFDNPYLKVVSSNAGTHYEIKQQVEDLIYLKANGSIIADNAFPPALENAEDIVYILTPANHWFAKHFQENPLSDPAINQVRPSIFGNLLVSEKSEHETILYRVAEDLDPIVFREISQNKVEQLFGANFRNHLLGSGGQGDIFEVTVHGQPYALKRARGGGDNEEQNALEKLLFTDAVVRVFAFFSHQNEIYMVMEKGQRSLRNMAEQGERLSGDQVLDAASRFKYLINVERRLNMRNSDVKPDNILLASDNRLKIIDIHPFAFSQGFIGSEGELYARSLLENLLGKSFRGGDISLDRYYEFSDPNYRARRVASLDFMAEWLKITCHAITSRDDPRCANARSFSEIFGYFTRPKLHEIALRINAHLQDDTGTHDNQYGIYRTGLPLPHVVDLDAPTWNNYFTQKNAIGSKFCKAILNEDSYPMYQNFFAEIRTTYSVNCNQIDDRTFQFMENFAGANDARFRLWITDALSPQVKLETFSQLAREQRFMDTMDIIFQKLHDIDNGGPVGQSLWQLYHLPR